jgi:CBS domain containing-hemolysin-like protein
MTLLLIYLFIALFISFLCSILEAVLLSVPISYLNSQAILGNKNAVLMMVLKEKVDKSLSAILTLNTVAHTVGAAGVGAQATVVFGDAYFGIVSAVLTILVLVVSEIIPKTIGANYSRELIGISARFIKAMIFVTFPLVYLSSALTKLFSRNKKEYSTSRDEILSLASIGKREGILTEKEHKIIQNLIKLKSIKVFEVMTPRIVVVVANEEMSLQEFMQNKDALHFSRIPVYQGSRDYISGYVLRSMVFEKLALDQFEIKLKDIRRNILSYNKSTTIINVWDEMLVKREHIALIHGDYGGMEGIITLEDIIESLLGFEIVDEKDKIEDLQLYALEKWRNKQKRYEVQ